MCMNKMMPLGEVSISLVMISDERKVGLAFAVRSCMAINLRERERELLFFLRSSERRQKLVDDYLWIHGNYKVN